MACSGAVLGDSGQSLRCDSCGRHYREFLIRVMDMVGMGALRGASRSGVTRGPSVGGINWSSPHKSRLWWVCVTLVNFWIGL